MYGLWRHQTRQVPVESGGGVSPLSRTPLWEQQLRTPRSRYISLGRYWQLPCGDHAELLIISRGDGVGNDKYVQEWLMFISSQLPRVSLSVLPNIGHFRRQAEYTEMSRPTSGMFGCPVVKIDIHPKDLLQQRGEIFLIFPALWHHNPILNSTDTASSIS